MLNHLSFFFIRIFKYILFCKYNYPVFHFDTSGIMYKNFVIFFLRNICPKLLTLFFLFLLAFVAHQNAIFDICWMPDKCQLITGSGDHHASLWDISSCKLISIFKKHTSSVKSIDVCHEQSGK